MKKLSVLIISLILTACGGGGGGDSTPAAQTPAPSTTGNTGLPGNAFSYDVDAGLLYYVVVVAEDLGGSTHAYRVQVLESRQQLNPFDDALPPLTGISATIDHAAAASA